jgi:hypothetical protein
MEETPPPALSDPPPPAPKEKAVLPASHSACALGLCSDVVPAEGAPLTPYASAPLDQVALQAPTTPAPQPPPEPLALAVVGSDLEVPTSRLGLGLEIPLTQLDQVALRVLSTPSAPLPSDLLSNAGVNKSFFMPEVSRSFIMPERV